MTATRPGVCAVVFDLDGTLVDTEARWASVREDLVRRTGGTWRPGAHEEMMGMSSGQWASYMHAHLQVPLEPGEILTAISEALADDPRGDLPLLPGAVEAIEQATGVGSLGVASSSPPSLIELVLELAGLRRRFAVVLSSEEVERGKPAPDVFLEACRRLEVSPAHAVAVEDSGAGIRSARAAGMRVVAVPNAHFPPPPEALAEADVVLHSLAGLSAAVLCG